MSSNRPGDNWIAPCVYCTNMILFVRQLNGKCFTFNLTDHKFHSCREYFEKNKK